MATEDFTFVYIVVGGMAPFLDVFNLGPIDTIANEVDGTIDSSTAIGDPIDESTGNLAAFAGAQPPYTLAATTEAPSVGEPVLVDVFGDRYILSNNPMLGSPVLVQTTDPYTYCFAADTQIATPDGERAVQDLAIGEAIVTASGKAVAVKWIGRQTLGRLFGGPGRQPVRIRADALGKGLPHSDLTVTADHGIIVDGFVINAAALVNGGSIDWVPLTELPERATYYHIETENHDVILANGVAAETFVDYAARTAFDNYKEYLDLYGAERIVAEMDRPRISSSRLVPNAIKVRLGIKTDAVGFEGFENLSLRS
ncbi:Hint domain-containing protein [Marinovum sp.]|uniref:Hint domain-containing protein n=1 Tax=Marinovum sp. TaxID=2024839 RepID=UPI002B276145|nr:Hint domain-containing protein [Marinovum sp.]